MTGGAALYARIVKSSAVYSVAVFAPTLASLVMLPIYTRYLSPADYGVIELLTLTQNLFSMLVGSRFAEALFYFYANAKDEDERNATVSTALAGAMLVGATGAALGWVCSGRLSLLVFQNARWTPYFHLSFTAFGLSLPMEMGFAWLRARDVSVRYVFAALARLACNVVFVSSLLVIFRKGMLGVLWGNVIATSVMALLMVIPCILSVSLHFVRSIFWRLLRFGMPLGISGIALFIIHSGDRFFLQRYVPLSQVGIYSLAYRLGMLVSLAQTAFMQYWAGQAYVVIRGEQAFNRFARINTYLMTLLIFGGVAVSVFAAPIVRTFTTARFWPCIPFVPWIAAAYVLRSQADYLRTAFYLHAKPGLDALFNWVSAGFCLAAYAVLIPIFKLWGAVAATGLTFILFTCLAWFRIRKLSPYWLEYRRLAKLLAAGAVLAIAGITIEPASLWESWIVACLCAITYPVLLWLASFLNENERAFVASSFKRLQNRALGG